MINIEVIVSEEVGGLIPVDPGHMHEYVLFVCTSAGITDGEANVVFIDDKKMTELNERNKGRAGTTDVLSFNLGEEERECIDGEVYVSLEKAKAQSSEFSVPFEEEVVRLVTHGLLHLAGRAHDTQVTREAMENETERLMANYNMK